MAIGVSEYPWDSLMSHSTLSLSQTQELFAFIVAQLQKYLPKSPKPRGENDDEARSRRADEFEWVQSLRECLFYSRWNYEVGRILYHLHEYYVRWLRRTRMNWKHFFILISAKWKDIRQMPFMVIICGYRSLVGHFVLLPAWRHQTALVYWACKLGSQSSLRNSVN